MKLVQSKERKSGSRQRKQSSSNNKENYKLYEENRIMERQVQEYKQTVHSQA